MTLIKSHIHLTALLFSLVCSNAVIAVEANKNENKNNGTGHALGDADLTDNAGGDFKFALDTRADTAIETNDSQLIEKEWHRQQQEIYKQYLQERNRLMNTNRHLPTDAQSRRNEYIKHMEQRRDLFNKMNEQQRRVIDERREKIRQKMHQTSTDSGTTGNS